MSSRSAMNAGTAYSNADSRTSTNLGLHLNFTLVKVERATDGQPSPRIPCRGAQRVDRVAGLIELRWYCLNQSRPRQLCHQPVAGEQCHGIERLISGSVDERPHHNQLGVERASSRLQDEGRHHHRGKQDSRDRGEQDGPSPRR